MAIAIYIFFLLAVFHLIWEGILAPSFRSFIASKLRRIRDRIVDLKIQHPEEFSNTLFKELENSIGHVSENLSEYTISRVVSEQSRLRDKTTQKRVDALNSQVESCPIQEVKKLFDESSDMVLVSAVISGLGGWIAYALPFLFIGICLGYLFKFVSSLRRLSKQLIFVSHEEMKTNSSYGVGLA